MSAYFETHPPRLHQWQAVRDPQRKGRFHEATGTIVVHTFEASVSLGTKRAANFLVSRTDRQASYHAVCGPASERDVIQMAPWSGAAWHETHSNRWSIGISMVTQAAAWSKITATQRDNLVASAAYAAYQAATWLKQHRNITVPAARITRAQAMNGRPGFIGHGEMDPGRRSDPGAGFPWSQFLNTYAALMGGTETEGGPLVVSDAELDKIAYAVWSYQNKNADKRDAFGILRGVPKDTWLYKNAKVTSKDAYSHLLTAGNSSALVKQIKSIVTAAVKNVPGVDGNKLANEIADRVVNITADDVASEVADKLTVTPKED